MTNEEKIAALGSKAWALKIEQIECKTDLAHFYPERLQEALSALEDAMRNIRLDQNLGAF